MSFLAALAGCLPSRRGVSPVRHWARSLVAPTRQASAPRCAACLFLKQAFTDYMAGNPNRAAGTEKLYLEQFARYLGDWQLRPLDSITRRDVEDRFSRLTEDHGWACANRGISLLGSIFRRPCVDFEGLRNPVELWRAGGGKYHRPKRRKISAPAEVLPRWRAGIEAVVATPKVRDAFCGSGSIRECASTRCCPCGGNEWTWRGLSSGSRRPKPVSPWNCPSPGNWRPSSNAATGRAKRYRAIFAAGCSRPQPEQATSLTSVNFYARIGTAGGAKF